MIEGAVIEPFQGSESERIATQGGALRAYPGLCHRTPLGFRRGVIAETLRPDRLHNCFMSSLTDMVAHPAYPRIIADAVGQWYRPSRQQGFAG